MNFVTREIVPYLEAGTVSFRGPVQNLVSFVHVAAQNTAACRHPVVVTGIFPDSLVQVTCADVNVRVAFPLGIGKNIVERLLEISLRRHSE